MFKKFLAAAIVAALFAIGIVGIASAHASEPANQCQHAFVNWEVNRTAAAEEALFACTQGHTINGPASPFAFNTANFGFNNGFGFNPALGFNPGFGPFVPIGGFGANVAQCPGGFYAHLNPSSPVSAPSWECLQGAGNPFPGPCPGPLHLIEVGPVNDVLWTCQL